jgi:hypothetical protein
MAVLLAPAPSPPEALGERYTDPETGYTLRPPRGWEARPHPFEKVSVVFAGPVFGGFSANLNVVVLPGRIEVNPGLVASLARKLETKFERKQEAAGAGDGSVPTGAGKPMGYRITRRGITRLAGMDAAYLEARYEEARDGGGSDAFRQFQVIAAGPVQHYILTYTAREEAFAASLTGVQASINSFTPALGPPHLPLLPAGRLGRFALALVAVLAGVLLVLAWRARGIRKRGGRPPSGT